MLGTDFLLPPHPVLPIVSLPLEFAGGFGGQFLTHWGAPTGRGAPSAFLSEVSLSHKGVFSVSSVCVLRGRPGILRNLSSGAALSGGGQGARGYTPSLPSRWHPSEKLPCESSEGPQKKAARFHAMYLWAFLSFLLPPWHLTESTSPRKYLP